MRLLVIIKNTPSSPIHKRRRSAPAAVAPHSAGRANKVVFSSKSRSRSRPSSAAFKSRRQASSSRKVILLSPKKKSLENQNSIPDWLLASCTSSPFVCVPPAPHNTTDYLIQIHSSSPSSGDSAAADHWTNTTAGDDVALTSSSSQSSIDSFDYLDTFGTNFGLINPTTLLKSFHDSFHHQNNSCNVAASQSMDEISSASMIPVEAR